MAQKEDTTGGKPAKKPGFVGRLVKAAAHKLLSPLMRGKKDEPVAPKKAKKSKKSERTPTPRDTAEPEVRRAPARVSRTAKVTPIETLERHGAARDERSFEQRRRGGPMTGGAPGKAAGPRHAGGAKRRGRDTVNSDILDAIGDLPIVDYDDLTAADLKERIEALGRADIERLVQYERANKHRKSVVTLLEKRLAA